MISNKKNKQPLQNEEETTIDEEDLADEEGWF